MNNGWIYREKVKPNFAGYTVLEYYTKRYKHSTKEKWQDRILNDRILVNGKKVTPNTILKSHQLLEYNRPPWLEPEVPLSWTIIDRDRDLLVINKPSGLPVLPGGGFLENTVWWQLKKQYPDNTPTPIHRLGRGTSGLLINARSQLAKTVLSSYFRSNSEEQKISNRSIQKIYLAKVSGNNIPDRLEICDRIGKISHPILGYIYGATSKGKFAYTQCEVLERGKNTSIVKVEIFTGRPHQIRIHLAAAGYPLLGDPLYKVGGVVEPKAVPGNCGYYLHAYKLSFKHPVTKRQINLIAPPPEQLQIHK